MMKTIEFPIEPDSEQRDHIDRMIEANRIVFNDFVGFCKERYAESGKLPTVFDLNRRGTALRHIDPLVESAYAMTLNETSKRVIQACEKTLGVHKKDCGTLILETMEMKMHGDHFPRHREQGRFNSYTYPTNRDFSIVRVKKDRKRKRMLKLGKVPGLIKCYNQRTRIQGTVKTCTIKRKDKGTHFEYTASITYEDVPKKHKEPSKGPVGVDIGVSNIVALSDGTVFPNDHMFAKISNNLAKQQRQLSRTTEGSERHRKIRARINHIYEKLNNHRKNNIETISAYIVNNHDIIGIEDLSVKALRRKSKSRKMTNGYNDASLGTLIRRIEDKALSAGRGVIRVDPKDTSQQCSQCGSIVKKGLGVRVHSCPFCGYVADRDVNAARNILQRALSKVTGMDRPSPSPV